MAVSRRAWAKVGKRGTGSTGEDFGRVRGKGRAGTGREVHASQARVKKLKVMEPRDCDQNSTLHLGTPMKIPSTLRAPDNSPRSLGPRKCVSPASSSSMLYSTQHLTCTSSRLCVSFLSCHDCPPMDSADAGAGVGIIGQGDEEPHIIRSQEKPDGGRR